MNKMPENNECCDKAMDVAVEIVTLELGLIVSKNKDEFMGRVEDLMAIHRRQCHQPVNPDGEKEGGDEN